MEEIIGDASMLVRSTRLEQRFFPRDPRIQQRLNGLQTPMVVGTKEGNATEFGGSCRWRLPIHLFLRRTAYHTNDVIGHPSLPPFSVFDPLLQQIQALGDWQARMVIG